MNMGVLQQLPPASWSCRCSGCTWLALSHGCIHHSSDDVLLTPLKSQADPNSCTPTPACLRPGVSACAPGSDSHLCHKEGLSFAAQGTPRRGQAQPGACLSMRKCGQPMPQGATLSQWGRQPVQGSFA